MSSRLYVGNLSFDTNADTLREAFSAFGTVEDVHVVADRETGYSLTDRLDDAGTLVPTHEREGDAPRHLDVLVGVAETGHLHADQDLPGAGVGEVHLDDLPRLAHVGENRCLRLH